MKSMSADNKMNDVESISVNKDNPAYKYIRNYVLKYIKANPIVNDYEVTKEDISDIKNNRHDILEWMLEEHLNQCDFFQNGALIVYDWCVEDENTFTSIYKLGRRYVRINYNISGTNPLKGIYEYSFVKQFKKKVIVYEYR